MNERIKELLAQAHLEAVDLNDTNWIANRFGMLVVQECIAQCAEVRKDANSQKNSKFLTQAGKMVYEGMWGGANNCAYAIQEHFGVKE